MTRRLIILGASGNAHAVLDIVDALNSRIFEWEVTGIIDDNKQTSETFSGLPILGPLECAREFSTHEFINCIGSDTSYRACPNVIERTGLALEQFCTLVHPLAQVSRRATIGNGCYVSLAAYVSGNAVVGDHVMVGSASAIGHDARVGDHSILARQSTINGHVQVQQNVYLGANSVIKQGLKVGRGALIGMGAVVTRDVAPQSVVVGNPARAVKRALTGTDPSN